MNHHIEGVWQNQLHGLKEDWFSFKSKFHDIVLSFVEDEVGNNGENGVYFLLFAART